MTGTHERLSAELLFVVLFLGAGGYAWRERRAEQAERRTGEPTRF